MKISAVSLGDSNVFIVPKGSVIIRDKDKIKVKADSVLIPLRDIVEE